MTDYRPICDFFENHDDYLVLMHASPDGDTIGSACALCAGLQMLGKRAKWLCADEIDSKYDYMLKAVKKQEFEPKTIVTVDVADVKLLGGLEKEYGDKITLNIDHHASNKRFAEINYIDSESSSNCMIIYVMLMWLGVDYGKEIADCLYTGMSTDTGCFRYSNTTAFSLILAANVLNRGANAAEINRIMFETKSRARLEVEKQVLDSMEFYCGGKIALIVITAEMQKKTTAADLEGITPLPRQVEGVIIGVTLKEKDNGKYKVSVRTFPPADASKICAKFSGGGHSAAAGCEIEGSLDEVKKKIIAVCEKEAEK